MLLTVCEITCSLECQHTTLLVLFDLIYCLQLLSRAYFKSFPQAILSTPMNSTTVNIFLFPNSLFPVHDTFLIFLEPYFLIFLKPKEHNVQKRSSLLISLSVLSSPLPSVLLILLNGISIYSVIQTGNLSLFSSLE